MLRFVLRRLASGVVLVRGLSSLPTCCSTLGGQHRPQHPRPVGDRGDGRAEGSRSSASTSRCSRSSGDWLPTPSRVTSGSPGSPASRRPRRLQPARRHALPGHRRDARDRGRLRGARGAGRRAGRLGRPARAGRRRARLRDPGLPDRARLVLVFAINLGWFKPTGYIPFTESPTGWLVVGHPAGHRAGARRHRRGRRADPRLDDRRARARLRAHPAQPRPPRTASSTSTCSATPAGRRWPCSASSSSACSAAR